MSNSDFANEPLHPQPPAFVESPYRPSLAEENPAQGGPPVFRAHLATAGDLRRARPQPTPLFGFLAALGFVAFQLVLAVPVTIVAMMVWGVGFMHVAEAQWLLLVAGTGTACMGAIVTMPLVYGRAAWRRIGLRWPSLVDTLLVVVLFLPLAAAVSELNNFAAHYVPNVGMELMAGLGEMPVWLIVFGACLFPAVGEEIFFRGFIGRGLVGSWGPVAGVLVTSLLFGAVHLVPLQAISAFVLGIALHYVYLTTKSLAAPMLLHFLNNLLATLTMRYREELSVPGLSSVEEGALVATPVDVLTISLALVGLVGVLLYFGRTRWETAEGKPVNFGYVTGEAPNAGQFVAQRGKLQPLGIALALAGWGALLWRLQASLAAAS